jgi:uncharacterized membrane protein (UPF0127 family)
MQRLRPLTTSGCALFILAIAILGCARGPCVTIVAPDGKTRAIVSVEIADTPSEREVGLMYRKSLDAGTGMLFVFASPSDLKFWMRNTEIPLDMIFADASGRVVGIVANAEPYSDKEIGVDGLSQYVLEVNGGFAAQNSITRGDRLDFSGFSPHAAQ